MLKPTSLILLRQAVGGMDQFSAHAVVTATNEPKAPASRNRLEGHLCVVGGECYTVWCYLHRMHAS